MKCRSQSGKDRKIMSVIWLDDVRKKREKHINSESQSTQSTASEEAGQTPTELDKATDDALTAMFFVLKNAKMGGFTTKSKFARDAATIIAVAATEDLITTKLSEEEWGNIWFLTEFGHSYLKELENAVD